MSLLTGKKIAFIGGGSMAEAILTGIIKSGLTDTKNIWVGEPGVSRRDYLQQKFGINTSADNTEVCKQGDLVILAVKPYLVQQVLSELAAVAVNRQIFVSIAAGINCVVIENILPQGTPVVRVMPNTPCLVGEGAAAIALGKNSGPDEEALVNEIFGAVGKAVVVKEQLIDAVTGLSGSGPAYMYLIMEALADGAVMMGLPRHESITLAAQTMLGAAKMVLETGEHPGKLKDMVTTPGGTTIAGMYALEKAGVRGALMKAVSKATKKAGELTK